MIITNPVSEFIYFLLKRLRDKSPSLRYIGADMGQMENYPSGGKPPISFPGVLFDVDDTNYGELGQLTQLGESVLIIRVCQPCYSGIANSIAPDDVNIKALDYLETEQEVYLALQGWSCGAASTMVRISSKTENRNDEYRVKVMRFSFGIEDNTANRPMSVSLPDIELYGPFITKP